MVYTLFSLMFKVFFVAAAAYLLRRRGADGTGSEERHQCADALCGIFYGNHVLSAGLFSESGQGDPGHGHLCGPVLCGLYPGVHLSQPPAEAGGGEAEGFVCSLVFCNITFIGYPILQELYGNIGLLCAIVFSMIYNVVFYSWGMFYLGDRGRGSLRSILTNKIALASVLALVMYFLQIKIPEPLYSTFNGIGALTMPLSMIIIGCSLADSGICKILWDRTLYLPTVLRMAVMPAVVCLVMRLLGVDPEIIRISTVIAALPSGTMTSIVAADYGCAPDYAANIMVQTMLAMLAALPAWVFLVGM